MSGVSIISLLGLATAVLCLFLGAMHLAFWTANRADRSQLWLALCLFGISGLNLALAGSGKAAHGALGWTIPWFACGALSPVLGWPFTLRMIWSIADERRCTYVRRAIFLFGLANGAFISGHAIYNVVTHLDPSMNPTWEELTRVPPFAIFGSIMGTILSVVAIVEGLLAWRRGSRSAWLLLPTATATLVLGLIEAHDVSFAPERPSIIGLVGVPLCILGSTVMLLRYRSAVRGAEFAGAYKLVRKLGAGGMGELYLATRTGAGGFEHPVALKRVLEARESADDPAIEALLREARTAATLVHPNIVAVHDVGKLQSQPEGFARGWGSGGEAPGNSEFGWFIAMEWLPGVNLRQVLEASRERNVQLPIAFSVAVAAQVCRGLAHAHAAGIVHRDISPHNVMVTFEGAVKIVDFGIAVRPEARSDRPTYLAGKVPYVSPEQIRGLKITAASDLFSLGVTLYELLAGTRPFQGENQARAIENVLENRYRPLRELRPDVSPELEAAVHRALAGDRTKRWQNAAELGTLCEALLRGMPPVDIASFVRELFPLEWRDQQAARGEIEATMSTVVRASDTPAAVPAAAASGRVAP